MPETSVEVVDLNRPRLDVLGQSEVQSAAELHGEGVVVAAGRRAPMDRVIDVGLGVAVPRAEQSLDERLQFAGVLLELRTKHIGEHVAVDIPGGVAGRGQLVP